ncbi:MAG: cytochrome P450 [Myxococcota bacterium]|nr:cytochrome P450 [Myxococcota bacterium]
MQAIKPPDAAELEDPGEILAIISDPARRGTLYPDLHRLREVEPRFHTDALTGSPAWLLTRHADVQTVLRHRAARSDHRGVEIFDQGPEGRVFYEMQLNTLLFLPPDRHDRVRSLISKAFTPRSVEQRLPRIQQVVDTLLDAVEDRGEMDLVADFAYPLPMVVICEMLGVPAEDLPRFQRWAHDSHRRGELGLISDAVIARGEEATRGFQEYFRGLIEDHRKHPRDDLMSALLAAEDGGERLSDEDLVGSCYILLQAGHGTTADLIAMSVNALLENPEQEARLRDAPEGIPVAVEEFLRFDTSVQISQRVADEAMTIGGQVIPPGEVCVLFNGAANRDPEVFASPDQLDVARTPNPHLTFGMGYHTCLGASLARLEIQTALRTLLARFPKLKFSGARGAYRSNLFLRGLSELPLRFS